MSILKYYNELNELTGQIKAKSMSGKECDFADGADKLVEIILKVKKQGRKIIFIGNGASAAISSHQSADYSKNGGIRAIAFSDPALLTCMGNDFGFERVFEKPVNIYADAGDLLVAISSSGKSANIINAVKAAVQKKCEVVTLSGFEANNPLSNMGMLNFYVPSREYSHIEILHHSICHYVLEMVIERNRMGDKK